MKGIIFPHSSHFSVCVDDLIYKEFQQLIDDVFLISKIKDCSVEIMEFSNYFSIIVTKPKEIILLMIFFDTLMQVVDVKIDYKDSNTPHTETIKKFIAMI